MKTVYVAGPYRGETRDAVELNISVARAVGLLAARKGWAPVIPHCNTSLFDFVTSDLPDEFWLGATLELMRRCDAVVLIPGWQRSTGTLAEIAEAERLGMSVFKSEFDLPYSEDFS
jgi:hypothetical protein